MTYIVKLLDWGEDGFASETETATLRASFKQEVAVWHELNHPNVTKVNISAYYVLALSCTYLLCNVYSGVRTVMSWCCLNSVVVAFFLWSTYIVCLLVIFFSLLLQFVGASMGTADLKIPANSSNSGGRTELPPRACCVVVEYLAGGTLKQYLIKNRRRKLAYKVVVQIALDLARG